MDQSALVEGRPREGFRPWRELVTPHPDVSSGRYQEAEFADDLGQVHRGEGSDEYRDPVQFYRRTHITEKLHRLLVYVLRRLAGEGGAPVVELRTNFGGGKTHSMLALYHLFSADRVSDLVGIEPALAEAAVEQAQRARIAVLVGTSLSPGQTHEKVRRGGALFGEAGPCLVLIDERLAHARQLAGKDDMPAGSLAANLSFAQALTESARAVPGTLVVVTVPESEIEKAGQAGRDVLEHLKNVLGRMDSPWRPASAEESFEIVGSSLDRFQRTRGVLRLMAKGHPGPTTRASAASPPAGRWPARYFSARRRSSRRRTAGSRTRRSGSDMYRASGFNDSPGRPSLLRSRPRRPRDAPKRR